jgi:hypothetical protein
VAGALELRIVENREGAISKAGIYIKIRKEAEQLFTRTSGRAVDQRGTIVKKMKNRPPPAHLLLIEADNYFNVPTAAQ